MNDFRNIVVYSFAALGLIDLVGSFNYAYSDISFQIFLWVCGIIATVNVGLLLFLLYRLNNPLYIEVEKEDPPKETNLEEKLVIPENLYKIRKLVHNPNPDETGAYLSKYQEIEMTEQDLWEHLKNMNKIHKYNAEEIDGFLKEYSDSKFLKLNLLSMRKKIDNQELTLETA